MAEHLVLTDNNEHVEGSVVPTFDNSAGDGTLWELNPVSFTLVAWYTADEDNIANAGVRRDDNPAQWINIDASIYTDYSVTFSWTPPVQRTPHHYTLYIQNDSTFDFDNPATRVGECPGYLTSFEFTALETVPVQTFLSDVPSVTLNPIIQFEPTFRIKSRRGYNGKSYRKSWASDTLVDQLEIVVTQMSTFYDADLTKAHEGAVQLLSWLDAGTPLSLTETIAGSAATDPYIKIYYGTITGFDYLASRGKNSKTEFFIIYDVEAEEKV